MKRLKIENLSKKKTYKKQHEFYKQEYKRGKTAWSGDGKPSPSLVKAIRKIKPKLKLKCALDLGSGEGRHTVYLQKQGFKAVGLEYQKGAIENAQGRSLKNLLYIRGDIYRIPLKPGSFDLLVDYGVFHHVRRKDTAVYLNLLDRLLATNGFLLLCCFSRKFRHGNGKIYKRGYVVHKGHYDRFSSKSEIRKIFGERFKLRETTEESEGFLYSIIEKA